MQSEGKLASTAKQVMTDLGVVQRVLNSPAGRAGFIAGIAGKLQVKTSAVKLGALRHPHVGDGTVELPLSIDLKITKAYESLLVHATRPRIEAAGGRRRAPDHAGGPGDLARIIQAHITQQLTPVNVTPPAITGRRSRRADVDGHAGDRSNPDVTLSYQWQRCDGTGANCAAIAGLTSTTYAVVATDAGSTFSVVETATDRFGRADRDLGGDRRSASAAGGALARATALARGGPARYAQGTTRHTGAPWLRRGRFSG